MWPFSKRRLVPGVKVTPEDLQVLTRAYTDKPEYFRFLLSLRDQRREALDFSPTLKTESEVFAHGLRCPEIQRDLKVFNALINMPLTAQSAMKRMETTNEGQQEPVPAGEAWDVPEVPEERF